MKTCIRLENDDQTHFQTIFETHKAYKQFLSEFYLEITTKLIEFMCDLYYFSEKIYDKTVESEPSKLNTTNIDQILIPLERLKDDLHNFLGNMKWVQKLEEIGTKIKTMKDELKEVKDKVKDEVKNYIEGLKDIDIKKEEVQKNIDNIKEMNNFVVVKLKIAKSTIGFHQTLQKEVSKLSDVNFTNFDISEFLTNSKQILKKLTSFESAIKGAISKIKQEISKINVKDYTIVVQGDTYDESYYKKLISPVETFIDNSLNDIKLIKHILQILEQILELECAIEGVTGKIGLEIR